jgi:hypothetical protein
VAHSRWRHGRQSSGFSTIRTPSARQGAKWAGRVGPKIATMGVAVEAATCMGPLSGPANRAARPMRSRSSAQFSSPAKDIVPAGARAELYRAYPIENYDTAAIRTRTTGGVEIFFYVSHACRDDRGPVFSYAFEKGEATCRSRSSGISARFADGTKKTYGVPDDEPMNKLWAAIAAVRTDERPACGIQAAMSQILCLNAAQESTPEIAEFPGDLIRREGEPESARLRVEGLDEALMEAYEKERLPSEIGLPWARAGREIGVEAG